jgi:FKBP-type peptidyl-prolyl cis-trans isomerase
MNESKATILRSGLKILFLENGVGQKVVNGDKLKVHYKGFFIDGKPFDSSYKRQKPFEFILGVDRVIEGWTEGISLLKVGGKARLFIPYKLAYGNEGYGPIPEKSKLIFEVEIIESVK